MLPSNLIRELQEVVGQRYVLHQPEDLIAFEYDGSVDRAVPDVIVLPASTDEVSQVARIARRYGLPIVARGAATGLSGGAIASQGGISLALTRMKAILEIDPLNQVAIVEPGLVNIDLSEAASRYGLYYAPDPSSQKACTLGGNVAENSGGPHCLAYGVTTNHVLALEVVLSDGSVKWLGHLTGEGQGYDLRGILVGSEGTLAIVTKIAVRLLRKPEAVKTLLAVFGKMEEASGAVSSIIGRGIVPAAIEMMDKLAIQAVEASLKAGYPEDAEAILLVEVDGLKEDVDQQSEEIEEICRSCNATDVRLAEDTRSQEKLWAGRKAALGALGHLAPNYYLLDGVVPRTRLPEVLAEVDQIGKRHGLPIANVFHAGDGNLHPCVLFNERKPGDTQRALEAGGDILKLCVSVGGTLSGEHGVGIEKMRYMPLVFSDEDMEAMARLKPAFDTQDLLNPGKVFPTGESSVEVPHNAPVARAGPDAFI